jgi:Peptidase family M48
VKAAALALFAACVAPPQGTLSGETSAACTSSDPERCASALAERDLLAGDLDVYNDAALRTYVQGVADRLARGSRLVHPPRVVISNHDGTYAPFGNAVVIGRITIQKLGTEAELAAVVAHEMAHIEGHHATVSLFGPDADKQWLATRRDSEGIADERAVALLEHAGYSPSAMPRALVAELEGDDDEHPPRAERIQRVVALAGNRTGFEGRDELLRHLDKMVVGRDTRLGVEVDDAWVVSSLGIALDLRRNDVARADGETLVLRHGRSEMNAYAIGAPWAKEIASELDRTETETTAIGKITVGVVRDRDVASNKVVRLEDAVRATLPQPVPGEWVVVIERCPADATCGGMVFELVHGDSSAPERWLGGLRQATEKEIEVAEPARIVLAISARSAKLSSLIRECANPDAAEALDDPGRSIVPGEVFKCTDR